MAFCLVATVLRLLQGKAHMLKRVLAGQLAVPVMGARAYAFSWHTKPPRAMNATFRFHGDLIRFHPNRSESEQLLPRIPLGLPAADGGMSEEQLQDLLFRHPQALPIHQIDAACADTVPICRELSTAVGYIDAMFVNALVKHVVEHRLPGRGRTRNPQLPQASER